MRTIYIMANTNTHPNFSSNVGIALPSGSWLQRFGEVATRVASMIVDAEEPAHALRRKRYAALLG
jgi:hypothetical protein